MVFNMQLLKHKNKSNKKIILDSILICERKNCNTALIEKDLNDAEIISKLKEMEYKSIWKNDKMLVLTIRFSYTFYECPKCNFSKFVKDSKLNDGE